MENFINKCNKKAFQEIRKIQNASNMLEVEAAINTAIRKTFGLQDLGIIKVAMREGMTDLIKIHGASKYGSFDELKDVRTVNFIMNTDNVREYLKTFVPKRMKTSRMYNDLFENKHVFNS